MVGFCEWERLLRAQRAPEQEEEEDEALCLSTHGQSLVLRQYLVPQGAPFAFGPALLVFSFRGPECYFFLSSRERERERGQGVRERYLPVCQPMERKASSQDF